MFIVSSPERMDLKRVDYGFKESGLNCIFI